MRIQSAQLIPLGYGTYVRSDDVVAVEPITDERGPGQRSLVWLRGVPEPLVASRSEGAIADDLLSPADTAARVGELRGTLEEMVGALERIPAMLRRVIREEANVDLDRVVERGRQVLARGAL